jgi:sugar transferase EpsL
VSETSTTTPPRRGGLAAKRALDIVAALTGLLLTAPILLLLALAVRIGLGTPVLFRQLRPGLGGQPFMLLKFRTMTDARDEAGELLPDEQRMTPLGRFLRRSSLDELPELINVLRGEMSLVGPRPLLMEYLPHYTAEQARRHEVRPGLTGWAAIHGRNATTWAERLQQDVWYVDHRSFALDCRILLLTIVKVIRQEGISPEGRVTMTRFDEEVGRKA